MVPSRIATALKSAVGREGRGKGRGRGVEGEREGGREGGKVRGRESTPVTRDGSLNASLLAYLTPTLDNILSVKMLLHA